MIEQLESRRLLSEEGAGLIVFNTNRDGNYEIYSMNPDGSDLINLTNNAATDAIPQVSDDGTKVAFASDRGHPGNMDVWLMDIDGSHLVNITHNNLPGATNWDPAPSPDNSQVLYMGPKAGGGGYDLFVSDANGTNPHNLTDGLGGNFASWSDDGTKIVYGTYPPDDIYNEEIYWMNADGSGKTRVTYAPGRDSYPAFTPDAQHIAFMTQRDGDREIYRCDLDGSHLANLTNNHTATDQVPYYSPDGQHISFISYRDGDGEIYVMDADGSHQTRITNNPAQDVYPGWSETPELLSDMQFDFDVPKQRLRIPCNLDVSATLSKEDLQLINNTTGNPLAPSMMKLDYDHTTDVAMVTFTVAENGSLPDGNYHASIAAGAVADQLGHPLADDETMDFFALTADANHDRHVNSLDFAALAANFGNDGKHFSQGDFNYDGNVNSLDFNALAAMYGTYLAPAVPGPLPGQLFGAESGAKSDLFDAPSIKSRDSEMASFLDQTIAN